MNETTTLKLDVIEGIGPKTRELFEEHGLRNLQDLLRHSIEELHEMVDSIASAENVHSWQRMVGLMQVEDVDHQWAEALYKGGITTIGELSQQSLGGIATLFEAAQKSGLINEVPTPEQCCAMLCDATTLDLTGCLDGRVLDPLGEPLAGVEVIAGLNSGETDANGNFRLLRLPLAHPPALVLRHPEHETMIIENPVMGSANEVIATEEFQFDLSIRAEGISDEDLTLSELDGDTLPPINAYRMRSKSYDNLREGDVLIVTEFYKRTPDAKLVSRFKSFFDGEIIVPWFKIPLNELPSGIEERAHVQVEDGKLVSVEITPESLHRSILTKRAQREILGDKAPTNVEDLDALIKRRYELLEDEGLGAISFG